jgi:hypothetical protein
MKRLACLIFGHAPIPVPLWQWGKLLILQCERCDELVIGLVKT